MDSPAAFDPEAIFEVLARHKVRHVVIGAIAAILHGSPYPTWDLDICPERARRNLARLSAALNELEAGEWDHRKDTAIPREWSPELLSEGGNWLLLTRFGRLDLVFEPAGTSGYSDLKKSEHSVSLEGVRIQIAALDDIIRMKEAAGRERDREHLPTLLKLREHLQGRPNHSESGSPAQSS